jgi:hypothetical protein
LNEQLLGIDRAIRFERDQKMRSDGGTLDVLPVTAGAIQIVLLPAIIDLLRDGVPWGLMVGIP